MQAQVAQFSRAAALLISSFMHLSSSLLRARVRTNRCLFGRHSAQIFTSQNETHCRLQRIYSLLLKMIPHDDAA